MKAVHCPIDTSLNFTQANKLIRDLKPGTLVLPESYILPPVTAPHRIDLVVETDRPIISFKRDEVLTLPLKRKQGRVELSPELAEFLLPNEVRTGILLSTLTGGLQVKDNKHILKVTHSPAWDLLPWLFEYYMMLYPLRWILILYTLLFMLIPLCGKLWYLTM